MLPPTNHDPHLYYSNRDKLAEYVINPNSDNTTSHASTVSSQISSFHIRLLGHELYLWELKKHASEDCENQALMHFVSKLNNIVDCLITIIEHNIAIQERSMIEVHAVTTQYV